MRSIQRAIGRLGRRTIALPILYMALIFGLSSIPGGKHDVLGYGFELSPRIGNFLHLPLYYLLGLLWLLALEARGVPRRRAALLACAIGVVFGALDEVHQYFVPLRSMDIRDVAADAIGVLAAALTWPWIRPAFLASPGQPIASSPRGE